MSTSSLLTTWRIGSLFALSQRMLFSHTHTEIFFGFARDFLSYFLFGFFKSDAKLLRWGINQSNAGTTRNAHKEQHQQQQQHWQQQHCQQQQQLRGKRAWQLNERVVEEWLKRGTGCLACKESHWQESMQTFSIKNCSAICQLALPHLNVCTFACVCVSVCGCVWCLHGCECLSRAGTSACVSV